LLPEGRFRLILKKEGAPDRRGDAQSECESETAQREPQSWMNSRSVYAIGL
jgi:hypothetical protein